MPNKDLDIYTTTMETLYLPGTLKIYLGDRTDIWVELSQGKTMNEIKEFLLKLACYF
jgi:hypothetical protein